MISRYEHPQISGIFSQENRIRLFLEVEKEVSLCRDTKLKSEFEKVDLAKLIEDMNEIEAQTKHETMAFVMALSKQISSSVDLHRGLTSSDVLDTCLALQMKKSCLVLEEEITLLIVALKDLSLKHKHTPMIGRSHGKAGEVITFGLSFLSFYSEWVRNLKRLEMAREEVSYGMISGPMGNYTNLPIKIENKVCTNLGLKSELTSTQVIPRDRHAFLMLVMGLLGASLERLSIHIRNLSQSGIEEVAEHFGNKQTGSSAMPHKKNPILSENVTGLARLLKSYVSPSLDNVPLWFERDMSHSSVERVTIEDSFHLSCFAIQRMRKVIQNLYIDTENLARNIKREDCSYLSHSILCLLMSKGFEREEAYNFIQTITHSKKDLLASVKEVLTNKEIKKLFSIGEKKIDQIFIRTLGEKEYV